MESSNQQYGSTLADDSNDSFMYNDGDSLSASGHFTSNNRLQMTPTSLNNFLQTRHPNENRLNECLNHLHKNVSRKDKDEIFQFPVTDDIAPGYSLIIRNPMDLSTMKKKIDKGLYKNILEYRVI
jgi:hypothetical protein